MGIRLTVVIYLIVSFSDLLDCILQKTIEMECAELTISEQNFLQQNVFETIAQIRSNNKRPDLKSIDSYLVRIEKLKELSVQFLQELIFQLEDERKTCQ